MFIIDLSLQKQLTEDNELSTYTTLLLSTRRFIAMHDIYFLINTIATLRRISLSLEFDQPFPR